jgi:hypothetical protein
MTNILNLELLSCIVIIYFLLEKDNNSISYQKNLLEIGINVLSVKITIFTISNESLIISFEN